MELIGNALNGTFIANLVRRADGQRLQQIKAAVAYVSKCDDLFDLADRRRVPFTLYALADGEFPTIPVIRRFVEGGRPSWQLFLTRSFYHPKIVWFRGVGAYIGSANLSDAAWFRNLECGVWFDNEDLLHLGWEASLSSMFDVIASRSTAASAEHLRAYESLRTAGSELDRQKRSMSEAVQRALRGITGDVPPSDPAATRGGGAAKAAFTQQWNNGLTILRKMTSTMGGLTLPAWVDPKVPLSIVQDQATEAWYHAEIRSTGESAERIERLHERNRSSPDDCMRGVLEDWCRTADPRRWAAWVNDNPMEVHRAVQREQLRAMKPEGLARVLLLTHSSREHARQIRNETFGLPAGTERSEEERCALLAAFLFGKLTAGGKGVLDVLEYVFWGDDVTADASERIWNAVFTPEWWLPHLGVNIYGELLGYARPETYPPRNGRVSKTLYALGYDGVDW